MGLTFCNALIGLVRFAMSSGLELTSLRDILRDASDRCDKLASLDRPVEPEEFC